MGDEAGPAFLSSSAKLLGDRIACTIFGTIIYAAIEVLIFPRTPVPLVEAAVWGHFSAVGATMGAIRDVFVDTGRHIDSAPISAAHKACTAKHAVAVANFASATFEPYANYVRKPPFNVPLHQQLIFEQQKRAVEHLAIAERMVSRLSQQAASGNALDETLEKVRLQPPSALAAKIGSRPHRRTPPSSQVLLEFGRILGEVAEALTVASKLLKDLGNQRGDGLPGTLLWQAMQRVLRPKATTPTTFEGASMGSSVEMKPLLAALAEARTHAPY